MVAILAFLLAVAPALTSAATIDVQVGANGQLLYSPENVAAVPGDQVVFHFNPKNHTVTQSSFANPCGFNGKINSGFMPVTAGTTPLPTFTVTVNDTDPVWIYCAQGARTPNSHCAQGMVFAINCGADGAANSFANFKKAAMASGNSTTGGGNGSVTTAAYGGVTIPAAPSLTPVTQVVTFGSETWTTTYSSYPNSPGPTPVSPGREIKVVVGGPGKLVYDPPHVVANPRDVVVFEFRQKNHTVTQSSFEAPCRRLNTEGVLGFDSGFMPVADNATVFPTYRFNVSSTSPTWVYCRQTGHCGQGMVFAINSDESSPRSFQAFQDLAKTLNGTGSSSAATPSSTTGTGNSTNDASRVDFGFAATLLLPLAFLGFAL